MAFGCAGVQSGRIRDLGARESSIVPGHVFVTALDDAVLYVRAEQTEVPRT